MTTTWTVEIGPVVSDLMRIPRPGQLSSSASATMTPSGPRR
jgi:hypothetical protein